MNKYERMTKLVYVSKDGKSKDYLCDASVRATNIRLGELEDKIENGTLMELPCKVGDRLYKLKFYKDGQIAILCGIVERITIYNDETVFRVNFGRKEVYSFDIDDFGEYVFLTESEAEQKLKEIKEEINYEKYRI